MRVFVPFLVFASLSSGALAAGHAQIDNSPRQLSVRVDRRASVVSIVGQGRVEFRPATLTADGHRLHLTAGAPLSSGPRVTQSLGHGVILWYVKDPFGFEQGFELEQPLGTDRIALDIDLGGDLLPYRNRAGLRFGALKRSGKQLSYSRFIAYDANHRRLPATLSLDGRRLTLSVDVHGALYPVTLDPLLSTDPILLNAGYAFAAYQTGASADGTVVVVGAPYAHTQAGEVYVFTKSGSTWGSPAAIANPAGGRPSNFGYSVGISADGKTLLAGAPVGGTFQPGAYVYTQSGGNWTLAAELATAAVGVGQASSSRFGSAVALSADGQTALVGASLANSFTGGAYVYRLSGSTWSVPVALSLPSLPSLAQAGFNVVLSADGNTAVVGAPLAHTTFGAMYAYTYDGSNWSTATQLPNPATLVGNMGLNMGMSGDGTVLLAKVMGATTSDPVYAYQYSSGSWTGPTQVARVSDGIFDYHSVALSQDGSRAVIGSPGSVTGAAYVMTRSGSTWSSPVALSQTGQGSNTNFGWSAAITPDGDTGFVGAVGEDVFVYESPVDASFSATPSQSAGTIAPGTQITFQFSVTNSDAEVDATNLVLDEVLPAGASYVSSDGGSGACTYSSATGSVTCTLASLAAGGTTWQPSVTLATASSVGTQTNTVSLSADQALDGVAPATSAFYNDVTPVAVDSQLTDTAGRTVTGTVTVNPGYTGQTLTYAVQQLPSHGTLTLDTTIGAFQYHAQGGFKGTDQFTFDATDGRLTSNVGDVQIKVALPTSSSGEGGKGDTGGGGTGSSGSGSGTGSTGGSGGSGGGGTKLNSASSGGGGLDLLGLLSLLGFAAWRRTRSGISSA